MRIQLNDEAINQLGFIMARTGYSNQQHCLQVMISSVANNLRRAECKKENKKIQRNE